MRELLLASSNQHKAEELSHLLNAAGINIKSAPEKLSVVEDGSSFQENALIKAKAYFEKYSVPVVSDDSGLVVDALPNELGIHSARFGGDGLTDKERAELLLEKLKDKENRDAYFVCYLCFYFSPHEIYFFEGRVLGKISDVYKGDHGFGYDPIFIPLKLNENKTLAEDPAWKEANSHRSIACKHAQDFFQA